MASSLPPVEHSNSRTEDPSDANPDFFWRYQHVRDFSELIAAPLSSEDCAIQSMSDVSPTRWHLAHTTWFFETFLLKSQRDYQEFDRNF